MGTMLQEANPTLEDFQGHEGCNEILNVSKSELVKSVHRKYLEVGVDAIETNTFGANWANLAEYGIEDRIYELAFAGGKLAREVADEFGSADKPRERKRPNRHASHSESHCSLRGLESLLEKDLQPGASFPSRHLR